MLTSNSVVYFITTNIIIFSFLLMFLHWETNFSIEKILSENFSMEKLFKGDVCLKCHWQYDPQFQVRSHIDKELPILAFAGSSIFRAISSYGQGSISPYSIRMFIRLFGGILLLSGCHAWRSMTSSIVFVF